MLSLLATNSGHLLDPKIKNRSRIHYLMANIEASQFEGENNWALLLDPDGFVAGTGITFYCERWYCNYLRRT